MKTAYIFDVDGTLTPSRTKMNTEFSNFFLDFCNDNDVFIVTGSDRHKTIDQIGDAIYNSCKQVYQCSGNDAWKGSSNVYTSNWALPEQTRRYLETKLDQSNFEHKSGHHFDERPGMVNFSIVGRKCTVRQRKHYIVHDALYAERDTISDELNAMFGDLYSVTSAVAGETGLDITEKNKGKEQIVKDFVSYEKIVFFGDKCQIGGNDHSIAQALLIMNQTVFPVNQWEDTYNLLKQI